MAGSVALVAGVGAASGASADDDALLPLLTDAAVACGLSTGDPRRMDRAVRRCMELGVSIGAHPDCPDLAGATADHVRTTVLAQIGALQAIATSRSGRVCHVSPRGRLAARLLRDEALAEGMADAVACLDARLVVVTHEGALARAARARRLRVGLVFIADQHYGPDGAPLPADEPGAFLADPAEIAGRAVRAVVEGFVLSAEGRDVAVGADLVLLRGHRPGPSASAPLVREAMLGAGVRLQEVSRVLDDHG